jgi:DNA repair protein RadC
LIKKFTKSYVRGTAELVIYARYLGIKISLLNYTRRKKMNYRIKQLQEELYALYCQENLTVNCPDKVVDALKKYSNKKQEYFLVITLDGNHNLIKIHEVTIGTANRTLVHPREVFRPAILDSAVAVIIAHNHPSGNIQPSAEDHDVTRRMKQSGDVIGISVLDHMIVSKYGYYSAMESGTF